jgi:uncharacterized membrane protein YeiB
MADGLAKTAGRALTTASGTPAKTRIMAVDVTRGIALLGMLAANVFDVLNSNGTPTIAAMTATGRSATLFAMVAGISLALITGGRHPVQGPGRRAAEAGIAVRALLIGTIGLALGYVDVASGNVNVILAYYGLFFLLAIPLLGLRPRTLAWIAGVLVVVAPLLQLEAYRLGLRQTFGTDPTLSSPFINPGGLLMDLFVTGAYPAVVYIIYICAGLAIGRLDLSSTKVAVRLLIGGTALAAAAWEASWVLLFPLGGVKHLQAAADPGTPPSQITNQIVWDPNQVSSWWWLAIRAHHTGTAFDAMHTLGVAMAILGAAILVTRFRVARRLLWPVGIAGAMTLTIYSAQTVALNTPLQNANEYVQFGVLVAGTFAFAIIWHRLVGQGPLERIVAIGSGRTRSAVLARLTRAQDEPGRGAEPSGPRDDHTAGNGFSRSGHDQAIAAGGLKPDDVRGIPRAVPQVLPDQAGHPQPGQWSR